MKKIILLQILLFAFNQLPAKKYDFEEVKIIGVENPIFLTISPDGLKMIILDMPKKGHPIVKQTIRPSITARWGGATEIPEINDQLSEETKIRGISFSYNGKNLYLSANLPDSKGGFDLYSIGVTEDGYTLPENLGIQVNSTGNEYYPSVSGNERLMIFTRETEMKKLEDLHPGEFWLSRVDEENGKWSSPEKLNVIINDGGIGYPRIYDDNKTIFYSRADEEEKKWKIHWTKRIGDIHWYLPVKLDTLSSDDHEISPCYCKQEGFLYYVKYSGSESSPKGEMYRFRTENELIPDKTIEIKGIVTDSVRKVPVKATVMITDPILGRTEFSTSSEEKNGNWQALLPAGKTYLLHIWKDHYSHFYKLLPQKETMSNRSVQVEITPRVELSLNIYDKDELWPLDADLVITDEKGGKQDISPYNKGSGLQKLRLSVGSHYVFQFSKKDYITSALDLDLSSVVLFDRFIRDIELEQVKRNLEIFVTEKDTLNPLEASMEFIDIRGNRFIPESSGRKGFYTIALREGELFQVEIRGPKYYAFKAFALDLNMDRQLKRLTVELSPLIRKVPIRLNNINFELNSADLMQSSLPELDRVVRLLKDNPEIYVELSAHTCDIGSDRFNDVLSVKRAGSVVNYLSIKGISNKRMVARGYGEKVPLVSNTTEENRILNRRVELKILDEKDQEFQIEERIQD